MSSKVPLNKLVRTIAKRTRTIGISQAAFENKAKDALAKEFGQARAGKMARGLRSGSGAANLTKKEAVRAIKVLKKEKVLKGAIKDIKGEVESFARKEGQLGDEEAAKLAIRKGEVRRRIREKADETKEEVKRGKEGSIKSKDSSSKVKSSDKQGSNQPAMTYIAAGTVATIERPLSAPLTGPITRREPVSKKGIIQPDEEVLSLRKDAEEHDMPID